MKTYSHVKLKLRSFWQKENIYFVEYAFKSCKHVINLSAKYQSVKFCNLSIKLENVKKEIKHHDLIFL